MTIKKNCDVCGDRLVLTSDAYNLHIQRFHAVTARYTVESTIKPIRTTTRTVKQIVHDTEKIFGEAVFPRVMPWHSIGGR